MSKPRYVYGRHPVSELLRRGPRDVTRLYVSDAGRSTKLSDLVQRAERYGIPVTSVARRNLVDLVGDVPHQGVVAAVAPFDYCDLADALAVASKRDEAPLLVALDQIQDPQNLGAMIRSALAFGAHGVIVPKDRAAEVTPAVVKASAGATAHIGVCRVTNLRRSLEELKSAGLWVIGTVAEGGQPIVEIDLIQPVVVVIGSEGRGLRRMVAESCDLLAHIPMPGGLGSLNASVAAGVTLYEAVRQRAVASS